jgi:hypothetical protein
MKKALSLAVLGILFSIPAYAQHSMSTTLGPNGVGYIQGGNAGTGSAGSAGGSVPFHTLPDYPAAQFQVTEISGVGSGFIPSTWTQFQQGIEMGRAQLSVEQKPLGEIAADYRRIEKPKAKVAIVQDASGKAIIQRQ